MKYPLVVFDFDGTLADTMPFFLGNFDSLADIHGFRRLEKGQLQTLRGMNVQQLMAHVGLSAWKVPRVALHFRRLMAEGVHNIGLFDGIAQMLASLAEGGVKLGLVTSNSRENACAVLGEAARLFSYFECGASLLGKRNRLRRVGERSGFAAAQMLYVGDELRDLEAARAEQMAFAAVTWGYALPSVLLAAQPELVFRESADIAPALLG